MKIKDAEAAGMLCATMVMIIYMGEEENEGENEIRSLIAGILQILRRGERSLSRIILAKQRE
jgi:hypothetical protein